MNPKKRIKTQRKEIKRRLEEQEYYKTENNKMAKVSPFLSIITLNINGLN